VALFCESNAIGIEMLILNGNLTIGIEAAFVIWSEQSLDIDIGDGLLALIHPINRTQRPQV